jgi:peroxiredoxin
MGTEVLVILGGRQKLAARYARMLDLPFPVLADRNRQVYQLFDLSKAVLVIQRTASVVIDRDGVIRYLKRTTNPLIWLQESPELLEFVRKMEAQSGESDGDG